MTWTPDEIRLARSIFIGWFPRDADRFDNVLPCGTMSAVTALAHKAARTALVQIKSDFIAAASRCDCGKPVEHLDLDEGHSEWPCRIPSRFITAATP